jgi:hypothetical protein
VGCRIFAYSFGSGTEQMLPYGRASEYQPSIWRKSVAFVRDTGSKRRGPALYIRRIDRPARLTRLPGPPKRKCFEDIDTGRFVCRRTFARAIEDVELSGRYAATVTYVNYRGAPGFGSRELRLSTTNGRHVRQIAGTIIGLSGVTWVGPSFGGGRLYFYKACDADPSGCRLGGVYRYGLKDRRYARSDDPAGARGFAHDRHLAYLSRSAEGGCPSTGCELVQLDRLSFVRASAPRRKR